MLSLLRHSETLLGNSWQEKGHRDCQHPKRPKEEKNWDDGTNNDSRVSLVNKIIEAKMRTNKPTIEKRVTATKFGTKAFLRVWAKMTKRELQKNCATSCISRAVYEPRPIGLNPGLNPRRL